MLSRRTTLKAAAGLAALFSGLAPVQASPMQAIPVQAGNVLRGRITQGALLRGSTDPSATVTLDGTPVRVSPEGHFAFGLAWDRKDASLLSIRPKGGESQELHLSPIPREYKVQRINGLPGKYVDPPKDVLDRIAQENARVAAARARDTQSSAFADEFLWPVKGPLTGVYGSQRILNGVPRQPHFGLDIAAGEGTPIMAPVGAVVALAEPDLYYTGGTVILDHGHGVSSSYLHMSRIDVKSGDQVRQGDVIGAIGMTGRATGPHLCLRLNWFQVRLDPSLVLPAA
jgi:murein DD-endopeptidase MepM/ murein hydrolase activator NlpD